MGGGYRSPAYLIWVIGGLVTIVGVSVGLGFANPADQRVIFAILPLVGVWVAGILVMQARFAARAAGGALASEADDEPRPGDDPPTERAELARALAVNPLDPEAERAARKQSRGIALGQFGYTAVLMLLILVGVGLFYGGVGSTLYPLGESGPGVPVVFLPILVALLVGVVRIPFTIARSVAATSAQLEPLGLAMTETPRIGVRPKWGGSGMRTDVEGTSVISGRRHGRAVRIEMDARRVETRVAMRSPAFSVASKGGRLAGDAPKAARATLAALSPASRWGGVEVKGGEDGIVVRRRGGARAASEQRWMDDLWLAERLAMAVEGSKR